MRTLLFLLSIVFALSLTSCVVHTHATPANVTVVKHPAKYKVARVKGKRYYKWSGR